MTYESPTLEEMLKYWGYVSKLEICDGCDNEGMCWHIEGAVYHKEMLKQCPYHEIREAINGIIEMTKEQPIAYYAITGKWFECKELMNVFHGK